MILHIQRDKILIREADQIFLNKVDKRFTYSDTSECFYVSEEDKRKKRFWRKRFDKSKIKYICLLQGGDDKRWLPIGLLNAFIEFCKLHEIPFEIIDHRIAYLDDYPVREDFANILGYLTLREYQVEIVKTILYRINGIVKAPMSAGKTEIFLALSKLMNIKTLIVFPSLDLVNQTFKRAVKAGLNVGVVSGNKVDENHKIVLCNIQSSHKLNAHYKMVIVDECHAARSDTYDKLLSQKFLYRIGFSATPFNGEKIDDERVKKWLGEIIYEISAEYMIENKFIAIPHIKFIKIDKPINLNKDTIKWRRAEKDGILENLERNKQIQELCKKYENKILILIKNISHGTFLQSIIPGSVFLHGEISKEERQETIERFEKGEIPVLIASTIFDQGVSINNIYHLIIASGGKSIQKTIQRLGRGLRKTAEKHEVFIWDFLDACNPILLKHSKKRRDDYYAEGYIDIDFPEIPEKVDPSVQLRMRGK